MIRLTNKELFAGIAIDKEIAKMNKVDPSRVSDELYKNQSVH